MKDCTIITVIDSSHRDRELDIIKLVSTDIDSVLKVAR